MQKLSLWQEVSGDLAAALERDPAANSRLEVALATSSFHAVVFYRLASRLHRLRLRLLARLLMTIARWLTGVEIHPAAKIGKHFFIDHGSGVVIGETSEIGDDVTLYQGVTLGGLSPSEDSRKQRGIKRHPTLGDGVVIGSGAQVLGAITIGDCARVGANSVVLKPVPEGVTVVGIPARIVGTHPVDQTFHPYGTPSADLPDPTLAAFHTLKQRVEAIEKQVKQIQQSKTNNKSQKSDSQSDSQKAS